MNLSHLALRALIYGLLLVAFWLGLPAFHYAAALMIAVIVRHKDDPRALLAPVRSQTLGQDSLNSAG